MRLTSTQQPEQPEYRELEVMPPSPSDDQNNFEEPEYHSPDAKLLSKLHDNDNDDVFKFQARTTSTKSKTPEPTYSPPNNGEGESSPTEIPGGKIPDNGYSRPDPGYSKPDTKTLNDEPSVEPEYTKPIKSLSNGSLVQKAFDLKYEPNNNPDYYSTPCTNENDPLLATTTTTTTAPNVEYAQVDKSKKNKAIS